MDAATGSSFAGGDALLGESARRRLSAGLAVLGALALAAVGALQLAKDGSFWIDEAAVAQSLLKLSSVEFFGRLEGGQSFPRFLLLAIQALTKGFGYETVVARALPHLFFLLACAGWMRLVYLRFRDEPALVALAAALLAIPAVFFVYGAILKPYSFDACLALLPFLLRDAFYDEVIGRGERTWRGVALAACVWLSYPFAMVLLARLGGWWLARAVRGEPGMSPRGAGAVALAIAVSGAGLWATDLRHTGELADMLASYWGRCVIGHESSDTLEILGRMTAGWWTGQTEFSHLRGFDEPAAVAIRSALAAGVIAVTLQLFRGDLSSRGTWGSRTLGFAGLLAGLPLASVVVGYPVCAGRLTIFALLPLVVVGLEGIALGASWLRRLPFGTWATALLGTALVAAVLPTSLRDTRALLAAPAPMDLRPLIARTRSKPDLPILTNRCTEKMVDTLPEDLEVPLLRGERGLYEIALSESREAWLLVIPMEYCGRGVRKIRLASEHFEPHHEEGADAHLYHLRVKDPRRNPRKRRTP